MPKRGPFGKLLCGEAIHFALGKLLKFIKSPDRLQFALAQDGTATNQVQSPLQR